MDEDHLFRWIGKLPSTPPEGLAKERRQGNGLSGDRGHEIRHGRARAQKSQNTWFQDFHGNVRP